jgi:hypothetical protein
MLLLLFATSLAGAGTGFAQKYLPARDYSKGVVNPEPSYLEWKTQQGLPLIATTIMVVPASSSKEEMVVFEWLKRGMRNFFGLSPEIIVTDLIPEENAFVVGTLESDPSLRRFLPEKAREGFGEFPEQGYAFLCTPNRAFLIGVDLEGLKHAVQTLLQMIQAEQYIREFVLPPLEIVDFPIHDMRAVLLPLRDYRFHAQMNHVRQIIDAAEMIHMNTVFLQIDNAIKFDSVPEVSRSGALEKDTLRAIVEYAREAGLEVIPLVNTFSHQDLLLCPAFPDLCLDKETYDPSKHEVYDKLFAVFDEILEVCEPARVHVGREWIRTLSKFPDDEGGKLFVEDAKRIHEYLSAKNVEMMMWADMILAPEQCEGQDNCHGLLGNTHTLIDSLPKDIIMVEAHYRFRDRGFPSSDYLLSKGFRVIGCVSDDRRIAYDFSKYTAGKSENFLGMIVALWGCFEQNFVNNPVRKMRECAEAFWRGGVLPVDPNAEDRPQNMQPY